MLVSDGHWELVSHVQDGSAAKQNGQTDWTNRGRPSASASFDVLEAGDMVEGCSILGFGSVVAAAASHLKG